VSAYPTNGADAVQVTTTLIGPPHSVDLLNEVNVTTLSSVFFLADRDAVEMHV
jgi:hypothetical protein